MSDLKMGDDFAAFVNARYAALVRYGVALVTDFGRAEDLAQAALVKTSRAWNRLGEGTAESYTRTVMARAAWRSGRRHWRGELPTASLPERADVHYDPFSGVDTGDLLRRALATLPAQQRVALTLRYLDELSEAESAERIGCPPGTVKSRLARGLESLRAMGLLDDEPSPCRGRDERGADS